MKLYQNNISTCQIGPVRASYEHVFKPRVNEIKDGKPLEYSITMLIPKKPHKHLPDPDNEVSEIKRIIKDVAVDFFKDKTKGLKVDLIKDGDACEDGEEPPYPGYWYLKAATLAKWPDGEDKPLPIFDGTPKPIGKDSGFVSGDWCRVKVNFAPYDKTANRGVTCYLEGVQWLFKDEPLGGSAGTQASEFDAVTNDEDDPFQ